MNLSISAKNIINYNKEGALIINNEYHISAQEFIVHKVLKSTPNQLILNMLSMCEYIRSIRKQNERTSLGEII